jgi:tetratricopeptide (TPR) repeat protein
MYENKLICNICGGVVNADEGGVAGICHNCGHTMMYPKSDIKKLNRITYLRNNFRFDEAEKIVKELIAKNPDDSEVHWAAMLCEYGIQYIREGNTRYAVCRKDISEIPDLSQSVNYKNALKYSEQEQLASYERLGAQLEDTINITLNILKQDKKYDVFVLSREGITAEDDLDGDKIYLRFTSNLGFSTFFAPEVLKEMDAIEKAAQVVFALKNSRIMLPSFRTKDDVHDSYLEYAVNTFTKTMTADSDKLVFPIFDGSALNFQQLPEALVWSDDIFNCAEDEFMREISDKVESILKPEVNAIVPDALVTATAANKENLVKRAYMFLEDGEFETADSYFDKILDIDIEDSRAYIGKLLAECKLHSEDEIPSLPQTVTDDKNFKKALRFATPEQKARYEALNGAIVKRIEDERREIAEQRARLQAEREEKEAIERERRMRQEKEERKLLYQRRRDPLRKTLLEVQAELNKTFITPKRRTELKEEEETLKKNLKDLEAQFPDIWD